MPVPYSTDLRKKIIDAYNNNEGTLHETADRFGVSVKSVWNFVNRFRKENTLLPRHKSGGKPRSVNPCEEIILKELPAQEPDAASEELCEKFREKACKTVSVSGMYRSLKRMKPTRKKKLSVIRKNTVMRIKSF